MGESSQKGTTVVQYPIPLEEFAVGDLWHLDDFLGSESCVRESENIHEQKPFLGTADRSEQVIQVKKTRGAAAPRTRITWAYFLGSEEPLLKLLRSSKLQRKNSSPISNCRRSKSAIFLSRNINYNIKFIVAVTRRNAYYIFIYIYVYLSDDRYIPEVEMKTI